MANDQRHRPKARPDDGHHTAPQHQTGMREAYAEIVERGLGHVHALVSATHSGNAPTSGIAHLSMKTPHHPSPRHSESATPCPGCPYTSSPITSPPSASTPRSRDGSGPLSVPASPARSESSGSAPCRVSGKTTAVSRPRRALRRPGRNS